MRFGKSATMALLIIAGLLVLRLWLSAVDLTTRRAMAVTGGIIVVVLLLVIGVGIPLFELSGRRKDVAERLQRSMSERLRSAVDGLPLTVVAHVPESRRSCIVVEIGGSVPTEEVRATVLRAVRHEVARRGREVRVVDRLEVRSATDRPAA
jgi:hypothetical protein